MAYLLFSVQMKGSEQMRTIFDSVGSPTFMRAVGRGAHAEANRVMRISKGEVPLEDNILRGSATIKPLVIVGTRWEITLGYGGAASAYALIQHENMSFHHPGLDSKRKGQQGRKAKYLSDPVRRAMPSMEARLAATVAGYFSVFTMGAMNAGIAQSVAESNANAAAQAGTTIGGTS